MGWLICIFVAAAIATDYSDADSITGAIPGQDLIKAGQPLSDQPAGFSAPAAGGSEAAPTAATAAPPTVVCPTSPLNQTAVSLLRNLSGKELSTRLVEVAKYGKVEELQALLAVGADVRLMATDRWGGDKSTPLFWAAGTGSANLEVVRCLLAAGAHVDSGNHFLVTPLHNAAHHGDAALMRLLLAHSADPNAVDQWGKTPLHYAVDASSAEPVRVLLEAGANSAVTDDAGKTPLDIAWNSHKQEHADLLICS